MPEETVRRDVSGHRSRLAASVASVFVAFFAIIGAPSVGVAQSAAIIDRIRTSVVAVGTFQRKRSPQFLFRGTGFAVGDGLLIATNLHVLPEALQAGADPEALAVAIPATGQGSPQVRIAERVAADPQHDLGLLRLGGAPLPPLALRDSDLVRDGDQFLFTGFPIGTVLGLFPATHRAMIAAITPIAIPPPTTQGLNARMIRQLQSGAFPIFQLDATSFPGNSGSPLYDPATGEVVGVLNMAFVKGTKESALTQPSGISYAIPSKHLAALLATPR